MLRLYLIAVDTKKPAKIVVQAPDSGMGAIEVVPMDLARGWNSDHLRYILDGLETTLTADGKSVSPRRDDPPPHDDPLEGYDPAMWD